MLAPCICSTRAKFVPILTYKQETVFSEYEGSVIAKCLQCGILKTFPSIDSKKFNPKITKYVDYEKRRSEFEELFKPIVNAIEKYVIYYGTILDVGCSSAILLRMLKKKGYSVAGLEPNINAFQYAHSFLGDAIINGDISKVQKSKKFDCIIYNHVLEHISDINTETSRIMNRLNPGGVLIIGVPNTDNFIFKIRKKYWEYLLPNEHIWHFSTSYLERYFINKGFKILEKSFVNDKRSDYPYIKRLYFFALSLVDKVFNTGEAVLLVMKKNSSVEMPGIEPGSGETQIQRFSEG